MPDIDLGRRPTKGEDLEIWYAAALAEQESSGLSVAEFAEQLGVTATTLYHWRRRLARAEAEDGDGARLGPSGLVEVTPLSGRDRADDAGVFLVHLSADRSIEVPRSFDDDELCRLVKVLESC